MLSISQKERILERAVEALRSEGQAILSFAESLPENFSLVVSRLAQVSGKVFFTGVGKSAHIASKIASTLSSTGTPSCTVHPTEAGHGDLGALTQGDALVLLSNSGETPELLSVAQHAKRLGLFSVLITQNSESALARLSESVLRLPACPEVCPLGLAPTTSALLMLALGDALAVCLMDLKSFSVSDYHLRHPKGFLGRTLLKVSDIMHLEERVPLVPSGLEMSEALLVMTAKGMGCLGIVNPKTEELIGVITDGDLRRHMTANLLSRTVDQVMTCDPLTVSADMLVKDALTVMTRAQITVLFACDQAKRVIGFFHLHDCLKIS